MSNHTKLKFEEIYFSSVFVFSRAIFRWLTVKDLNKLTFEDALEPDSPMAQLHQIKQGLESYHNLFKSKFVDLGHVFAHLEGTGVPETRQNAV